MTAAAGKPILKMRGISKTFPGVKALNNVDFELRQGEVHALLGENGAGKSTLMKILAGMYGADSGQIQIAGQAVSITSPRSALAHGVAMVYQNFTLSPALTVLENIVLGSKIPFAMRRDRLKARVNAIVEEYGLAIDLDAKVWQLSVGEQQRVEIIKCFYHSARILILDEPTAVLTPPETEDLFAMIRKIVEKGCSVVFISHKLGEVLSIADRITVFRKGEKVAAMDVAGATPQSLSRAMVGRDVALEKDYGTHQVGAAVLKISELCVRNDKNLPALNRVSLEMRAGEILGIAAISGNGQAELAEAISALKRADSGTIELEDGRLVNKMNARQVIDAGVAHISEKRLDRSLVPAFSIADNLVLKDYDKAPYCRLGFVENARVKRHGAELLDRFGIAAPSPETAVRTLSGGNLQKVVLAREITRGPKILLAVNPTYGLDVGAIEFVQQQLVEQRNLGTAILLISEELDEVLRLSDRVLVMAKGEIAGEFARGAYDREQIGLLMTGGGMR